MKYDWSVLQQPDNVDGGSITDSSSQTITLSHLSQGVYVFQVEVTADGVQGRAVANVTVKPGNTTSLYFTHYIIVLLVMSSRKMIF